MTKRVFCHDEHMLVVTIMILVQLLPMILKGSRDRLAGDTVTTVVEHAVFIRDITNTNSWALKGSTHGRVFMTVKHQFSSDWTRNLVKNWVYF